LQHFDVVIVGAGPGGCSAAYFLARAGVRALLIDKAEFPRDKICGDAISVRSLEHLSRMGLEGWLKANRFHSPSGVRIAAPNGERATLQAPTQLDESCVMPRIIPREKLDSALLTAATEAGSCFMGGVRARSMSLDNAGATVQVVRNRKSATLRAQLVVAADGSYGSFSRNVGLQDGPLLCITARAYAIGEDSDEEFVDMLYEADVVPGYGWVFPLGNGICNVGIGIPAHQAKRVSVQERFCRFMSRNRYFRVRLRNYEIQPGPRGAVLYSGFRHQRTFGNRLLAVGDATGLVNPLTGAGISKALATGEMAAQCAYDALMSGNCSEKSLAVYGKRLSAQFGRWYSQMKLVRRLASHGNIINRIVYLLNQDEVFHERAQQALVHRISYAGLILSPRTLFRLLFSV
jgi:geranylgeranyl reductase family protein